MALSTSAATRKDVSTGISEMQHRHFSTIAEIIRDMPEPQREFTLQWFVDRLGETNPKFDRTRFVRACRGMPIAGSM
jgi:hypothetical protein